MRPGQLRVTINGREYGTSQAKVSRQLNPTGTLETGRTPCVRREACCGFGGLDRRLHESGSRVNPVYRGEPRIDANDSGVLENRYVADLVPEDL